MSDLPQDLTESVGPAQVDVTIAQKDIKQSPFNAICFVDADTVDGKSRQQGTAFIVKARNGRLAAITAGHVLLDKSKNIDCVAHPDKLKVFPGTYGFVAPNQINANSKMIQPASCIVHPKCNPASQDMNVAHYDIGIAFFGPSVTINGSPMSWAVSDGVLPKSPVGPVYSVVGHPELPNNMPVSCQMRMVKVEPYSRPVPTLFTYTSGSAIFGAGFSGGPVLNQWSTTAANIKNGVAYGHHVKKVTPTAGQKEERGNPATVWFAAVRYSGEIADWLRAQGL